MFDGLVFHPVQPGVADADVRIVSEMIMTREAFLRTEKKQVLVTWLDHTDLRAMAQCQSKAIQSEIKKIVQDIGPVKGICTIMVLVHAKCSCL